MTLKTLLTATLVILVAGLLTLPEPVQAKRFGGGGNVGKQYNTLPRQASPPQQAQRAAPGQGQAAAAQRAPRTSGASRWLGPLAGLAAGGLLASLFFGDAFEGFQVMDFLLIALLTIGGVILFRMLRRGQARPAPATAGAFGAVGAATRGPGASAGGYARTSTTGAHSHLGAVIPGRGDVTPSGLGTLPPKVGGTDQSPYWFDGVGFIEGAKSHFIRLQAAWDQGDLQDIREYTTPELFGELQRERERLGGTQHTEVVQLQAELLNLQRDGDLAVASIRFSGLIREEEQAAAQALNEVWHVQHPWASPEGDWHIAGIQQL